MHVCCTMLGILELSGRLVRREDTGEGEARALDRRRSMVPPTTAIASTTTAPSAFSTRFRFVFAIFRAFFGVGCCVVLRCLFSTAVYFFSSSSGRVARCDDALRSEAASETSTRTKERSLYANDFHLQAPRDEPKTNNAHAQYPYERFTTTDPPKIERFLPGYANSHERWTWDMVRPLHPILISLFRAFRCVCLLLSVHNEHNDITIGR
jgi:hypothetical protein